MAKLLPKKVLDSDVLEKIVKYYHIDVSDPDWDGDKFLDWECFSHPSLELHECNCRSRLPGGHTCKICEHVVGRPCSISCDFQNFCLAVFAWRLGIGGEFFDKAMQYNLYQLRIEELYDEVIRKFSMEEALDESSSSEEESVVEPEFEVPVEKVEEKSMEEIKNEVASLEVSDTVESMPDELLTITEAAKLYKCTYANIYNYVKAGRLPSVKNGRHHLIAKKDLVEFRDRPRSKKAQKLV